MLSFCGSNSAVKDVDQARGSLGLGLRGGWALDESTSVKQAGAEIIVHNMQGGTSAELTPDTD